MGHQYINLRWATAAAIEKKAGLTSPNLAGEEHRWRDDPQDGKDAEPLFEPFPEIFGGNCQNKHKLYRWSKFGGLRFVLAITKLFRIAWLILGIIGVLLILTGMVIGTVALASVFRLVT